MKFPGILVIIIVLNSFCFNALASDYFTLGEFCSLHPKQNEKLINFQRLVRNKGLPISDNLRKKKVKIAFIYPGKQISDYWRRSILSFKKRMDEIGVNYEIYEYFSKPSGDIRVQEKQLQKALTRQPDYLVFTLDAKKHKRAIERVITRSRPKLILQNITTPLKDWEGKQPFLYVGFDHVTGAEMLASYYFRKTGGKGKYALLYFTRGYVSTMRGDSFIRYLRQRSALKLAASYYTDGKSEQAKKATVEIVKLFPDIDFIYACSTDIAIGALDALKENKKEDQVMINGWGGGSAELVAIAEGKLDVTVMRMNDDNGVAMAEAIRLDISGRLRDIPVVYSGEFVLVEKGISKKDLDDLKSRAFRYSGVD